MNNTFEKIKLSHVAGWGGWGTFMWEGELMSAGGEGGQDSIWGNPAYRIKL